MEISYEEFVQKYEPVHNHFDLNASFDGYMFETYGNELDYVQHIVNDINPSRVWTVINGDDGLTWIVPEYHYVNRMGYIITRVPFESVHIDVNMDL